MRIALISIFSLLMLTGCGQDKADYAYLMAHPKVLEKEYDRCKLNEDTDACTTIERAASDFTDLVNDRLQNPTAFGKVVLDAETKLVQAQQALASSTHPEEARQAYQQQQSKVDALLAVIAATSSE